MKFSDILTISGQPGLFRYVAQSRNGFIVESLLDGRRMNASGTSRISALSEISMYTEGEDMPLAEIFTKMYAHTEGKQGPSTKENIATLKEFFAAVVPEYDRERVHDSDIKKAVSWFNALVAAGFEKFEIEEAAEEATEE